MTDTHDLISSTDILQLLYIYIQRQHAECVHLPDRYGITRVHTNGSNMITEIQCLEGNTSKGILEQGHRADTYDIYI